MENPEALEVDPEELPDDLGEREATLVDIREPREREVVALEDDRWIRMGDLPEQIDELRDCERPIVVYCHHGIRSLKVTKYLREEGFDEVYSLAGGIDRWAKTVDQSLPTY